MKCPSCKTSISVSRKNNKAVEGRYTCPDCNSVFEPKYGILTRFGWLLIGGTLLEVVARLFTELAMAASGGYGEVFGLQLTDLVSGGVALIVLLVFFGLLSGYKVVER